MTAKPQTDKSHAYGDLQEHPALNSYSRPEPLNKTWTHITEHIIHRSIRNFNVSLATKSATHPKRCLLLITLFSFGVVIVGFVTNFTLIFGHSEIFTPLGTRPRQHAYWIEHESNFAQTQDFVIMIHREGENVLNKEAVRRLFFALDTVRNLSGYDEMCQQSHYLDMQNKHACWIWSPTSFWGGNVTEFELTTDSDEDLATILNSDRFPDGTHVFKEALFGKYEVGTSHQSAPPNQNASQASLNHGEYLKYAPTFFVSIGMPYVDDTWDFQERLLGVFSHIRKEWQEQSPEENPHNIQVDFFCGYAYELEYARALERDFPLIPAVFFVMLGFTCFIFHRYGQMQTGAPSRATIGMASVVTVGMSMMSGFGVMFCFGVPFTNITLMAPFIILGVGLDDTFIITGAYFRRLKEEIEEKEQREKRSQKEVTESSQCRVLKGLPEDDDNSQAYGSGGVQNNPVASPSPLEQLYDHSAIVERVRSTMEEVGMSITLTTITTATAFVLGCLSTIPGIRWLCLYSSVTIVFDTIYQITYFIALLALDERRVVLAQAKAMVKHNPNKSEQRDSSSTKFFSWVSDKSSRLFSKGGQDGDTGNVDSNENKEKSPIFIERLMTWYARILMKPKVRNSVIFFCLVLFGVCVYSTTQLRQKFSPQDYVPSDSYIQGFFRSLYEYSSLVLTFEVFFRHVDHSDPIIRQQMRDYIHQLSQLPEIGKEPDACWVMDIEPYLQGDFSGLDYSAMDDDQIMLAQFLASALQSGNFTFEEILSVVLDIPEIRDIYGEDFVWSEDRTEITASKCYLHVRHIDLSDVHGQVNFLCNEQRISAEQPVNQLPETRNDWSFFSFSSFQGYWELYAVAVQELIFNTVAGVAAVCLVGFIVIPHWTAVCFVGPLIIMLYIDLLGIMQFCGIHINALTYVTIVISIGLLVDFLMHILLRYYESPGNTREEKAQNTLQTMGASMMLGGFTTWLGVIPMAMSTTIVFTTIFIAFLAMVSLGLLIGLAFLPAILSIWGPLVYINTHDLGKWEDPPPSGSGPTTLSQSLSPMLDRLDSPTSSVDCPTTLVAKRGDNESPSVKSSRVEASDLTTEGVDSPSTTWLAGVVHKACEHVPPMLDDDDEELATTVLEDTA